MNQTFTFSLSGIFALCVGFVAVSNVVNIIINALAKAKEPDKKQDEKILDLENGGEWYASFHNNNTATLNLTIHFRVITL